MMVVVRVDQQCLKARQLERQLITEGEQTLQRLDMEARSGGPQESSARIRKVKEYKKDLHALLQDVKKIQNGRGGEGSRAELGLADSYYQTSAGQRERLLTTTERLNKTGDKIQEGRKQLLETEVRWWCFVECGRGGGGDVKKEERMGVDAGCV